MVFLTAAAETAQTAQTGSWLGLIMPFVLMFVFFYFLLIRPQQKQQKQRQEMLSKLKKGDRVITVGGIHGEITGIKDDDITLRIADKTEIKITRAGVSRVKGKDNEE